MFNSGKYAKVVVLTCVLLWNVSPFLFAQSNPLIGYTPSVVDPVEDKLLQVTLFYNSSWELTTWQKAVIRREATLDMVNLRFSGPYKDYAKDNQLVVEGQYDRGIKRGFESEYFGNGELKSTIEYAEQGFRIWELVDEKKEKQVTQGSGKFKISFYNFEEVDHSPKLHEGMMSGEFLYGRRTGKWIYQDLDNKITDEEIYENGIFTKRTIFTNKSAQVSRDRKPVILSLPSLVAESFIADPDSYTHLNEYFEKNIPEYPESFDRFVTFPGGMSRLLLLMAVKLQVHVTDNILVNVTVDAQGHLKKVKDPFVVHDTFDEEFDRVIKPHELKLLPAIKNGKPYAATLRIPISNSPEWISYLQTASPEDVNEYIEGLSRDVGRSQAEQEEELITQENALRERREKARKAYHSWKMDAEPHKPIHVTLYYNGTWELTKPEKSVVKREAYLDFATLTFSGPYRDYSRTNKLTGDGYYDDGAKAGLETQYSETGAVRSVVEYAADGFIIWELVSGKGESEVTRGSGKFTIPFYQADESRNETKLIEGVMTGEFSFGKRVGTWVYTRADGKVVDKENYERGLLIRRTSFTEWGPTVVNYKKPILISVSSLATEALNFDRKVYTNLTQFFEENTPEYPVLKRRLITLHGGMKELLLLIAVNVKIPIEEITIAKLKVDEHGNLKKINLKPFLFDYDGRWNRTDLMNELERIILPQQYKFLPAVKFGKPYEITMRIPVSNARDWIEFLRTAPEEQVEDYLATLNQDQQ